MWNPCRKCGEVETCSACQEAIDAGHARDRRLAEARDDFEDPGWLARRIERFSVRLDWSGRWAEK